jgi:hypothetical protein
MIRELCFIVPHSTPAVNTPKRRAALFIGSSRNAHSMCFLMMLLPCGQEETNLSFYHPTNK